MSADHPAPAPRARFTVSGRGHPQHGADRGHLPRGRGLPRPRCPVPLTAAARKRACVHRERRVGLLLTRPWAAQLCRAAGGRPHRLLGSVDSDVQRPPPQLPSAHSPSEGRTTQPRPTPWVARVLPDPAPPKKYWPTDQAQAMNTGHGAGAAHFQQPLRQQAAPLWAHHPTGSQHPS